MTHTVVNYGDVEPVGGRLHFLRDPLDCTNLGFSVREMEPGETGMEHDHADDGQEEVYLLVEGAGTMTVEGESVDLSAGDAIRVDADATRQYENGGVESVLVIAGAP